MWYTIYYIIIQHCFFLFNISRLRNFTLTQVMNHDNEMNGDIKKESMLVYKLKIKVTDKQKQQQTTETKI